MIIYRFAALRKFSNIVLLVQDAMSVWDPWKSKALEAAHFGHYGRVRSGNQHRCLGTQSICDWLFPGDLRECPLKVAWIRPVSTNTNLICRKIEHIEVGLNGELLNINIWRSMKLAFFGNRSLMKTYRAFRARTISDSTNLGLVRRRQEHIGQKYGLCPIVWL